MNTNNIFKPKGPNSRLDAQNESPKVGNGENMEKRLGMYIVWGMSIGIIFGTSLGESGGNTTLGILLGALGGIFIGWFIAAAVLEHNKRQ